MRLAKIANALADPNRIGMTPELSQKLGLRGEEATRGQLMAVEDDRNGHLGVYLLATYVVRDTDFWDDGEIYWFAVAALADKRGRAWWSPLSGLPTGAPPHKCGSLQWMTSLSLADPPLLALIPPDEDIAACVLRFALYDDDKQPADVPRAIGAGLAEASRLTREPVESVERIITPIREAILQSLKAQDDDVLVDQDVHFRRGEGTRYGSGFITSTVNQFARLYFVVRDERRTEQAGPIILHNGQTDMLRFESPLAVGGRLSFFANGDEVTIGAVGSLSTQTPFLNRTVDVGLARSAKDGFEVLGTGAAKVTAFYTPP